MKIDCNCDADRNVRAKHKCFACCFRNTPDHDEICRHCTLPIEQPDGQSVGSNFTPSLQGFIDLGGCMLSDWAVSMVCYATNYRAKDIRTWSLARICITPVAMREIIRFVKEHWGDFNTIDKCLTPELFIQKYCNNKESLS